MDTGLGAGHHSTRPAADTGMQHGAGEAGRTGPVPIAERRAAQQEVLRRLDKTTESS